MGAVNATDIRINTYYITALCTYGATLTASEDLGPADEETKKSDGLDDPIAITYYTDSAQDTIYIGNQTATKEYFYVMKRATTHLSGQLRFCRLSGNHQGTAPLSVHLTGQGFQHLQTLSVPWRRPRLSAGKSGLRMDYDRTAAKYCGCRQLAGVLAGDNTHPTANR